MLYYFGNDTLDEGTNTIYARATDTSGNTQTTSITVSVVLPDSVKPTIVISNPSEGDTLTSTSITVKGTTSDNKGISKVEISDDGTNWIDTTGTTSWSGTLTLNEGSNTIYARVTDTSGNTQTTSITVNVDLEAKKTGSMNEPGNSTLLYVIIAIMTVIIVILIILMLMKMKLKVKK